MNNKKGYKIKDTSKMHHKAWNKGMKTGIVPKTAFKKGHKAHKTAFKKGENTGSKNCNWKGGISTENDKIRHNNEMRLWRKSVIERDNFTCQKTLVSGGKLHSHHINNFSEFPELRTSIENGVTLSEKSHIEFHKIYGKNNNTLEQILEFISK